jgi:hypothetical protein
MSKINFIAQLGLSAQLINKMFKICSICDFEWHSKDGPNCPACRENNDFNNEIDTCSGGAFGTGKNYANFKNFYAAIGIIALVLILYAFVIG